MCQRTRDVRVSGVLTQPYGGSEAPAVLWDTTADQGAPLFSLPLVNTTRRVESAIQRGVWRAQNSPVTMSRRRRVAPGPWGHALPSQTLIKVPSSSGNRWAQ
jgi:hypothetical protein